MKTFKELKAISDIFFEKCNVLVHTKPWAVCLSMHEYARNLCPDDPYIPFSDMCPTERLYKTMTNLVEFLTSVNKVGSYKIVWDKPNKMGVIETATGAVYGSLWSKFSDKELTEKATEIIKERLFKNDIDLKCLEGSAIDIGCGSGRFTFALKNLGCSSVIGVDYGDRGLKIARTILKKRRYKNITFLKHNVLNLPFKNEKFDFVFCNGVLHHTTNMELGIREMIRVAKKGAKIWFFIYGDGGIHWYSRKKMRDIMKKIPQWYTMKMLDLIGMPADRFIFCDMWYVPIEQHTTDKRAREIIKKCGISKVKRLEKGRSTDLLVHSDEIGKIMWGDGELRYLLEK